MHSSLKDYQEAEGSHLSPEGQDGLSSVVEHVFRGTKHEQGHRGVCDDVKLVGCFLLVQILRLGSKEKHLAGIQVIKKCKGKASNLPR